MIELHHVMTPNGHKVTILLEETGLPYEARVYNMLEGEQLTPAFRRINPNGRLPAMIDHDPPGGGAPFAVFESGAMLIYLAEKAGRFLGADAQARSLTIQWLMWQMAGLGPMHGQAHHFIRYAPEPIDYAVNRYTNEARRLLEVMDRRLEDTDFLAGDYSIADMACWPWVRAAHAIGVPIADYPALQRWFDRVGERPAVQRAAALPQGHFLSEPVVRKAQLTAEQWSILFGEKMLAATRG
ncbi:MAG: glutathione S-transferase C-terminal domain-containing protein [Phenylobacterium sp.]